MPRYNNSQRDPKLDKIAAIAQLYSVLQGPQMEQQRSQQQQAVNILGLLAQQQQAQQTLTAQQEHQNAVLAETKRATDLQSGQFDRSNALAQAGLTAQEQHQHAMEAASHEAGQVDLAKAMMSMPGTPMSDVMRFFPQGMQPQVQAMAAAKTQREVPGVEAAVKGMYSTPSMVKDPKGMQTAMDALYQAHPDAFNAANWDSLNALYPNAPASPPLAEFFADRSDGLIPALPQETPEYRQHVKEQTDALIAARNPLNLLFGFKKSKK